MPDSFGPQITGPSFLRGNLELTSNDKLKAPDNIIQTVQGAKTIYYQYRNEHLKRIDLYSQIEGLFAGNPPYNPQDLLKHRLSHIANFNNLDGRALYERSALAYWNLLNEAETLAKFIIRGDDPILVEWADTLSRHWNEVVRSWPSFYTAVNTLSAQIVKFGVSPVIWPDERDWRFRTIELSRFFIEDQAQTDVAQLTCVCVESRFTVQYLYSIYEEFKDKVSDYKTGTQWDYEKCPWNIYELAHFLFYFANSFAKQDFVMFDMMDIQRRIQNLDLTFQNIFSDTVPLVSLFYQEYDGKVSQFMFHPRYDGGSFLFKASNQYNSLQDGIIIFTASPGEFTIHSNRGLGHKVFAGAQAMMQLDCSIVDMARMSATPLIKTLATGARDFESIRFYPGVPTNIGTAEVVENTLGANINQLIGASQYIQSKLQYNTANSGDDPGVPDRSEGSISAPQAKMRAYKEFNVSKNSIAHFYAQFDRVISNMVVKMLRAKKTDPGYEYVEEWKSRCIEDGVPEEMFSINESDTLGMPRHLKVRASRVAGDGSTYARIMGLQELSLIAGDFGAKAGREYQRQWVMATMGPEYVPAFLGAEEPDEFAGGASLAGVENAVMRMGESPVFSPDNEHRAHVVTHLALGNDTIRRISQQQMTPVEADKIFTVLEPHLGEHLQVLSKSLFAQGFMKNIVKPWNELQQYATLNRKNAAKMLQAQIKQQQEQQAKTQQVLSDQELKTLQVQADEKRKDFKIQSQVERAREANQNRAEVMREKVQLDAENDRLKVQLENKNQTLDEQKQSLENKPLKDLRQDLADINGASPAPYNIE